MGKGVWRGGEMSRNDSPFGCWVGACVASWASTFTALPFWTTPVSFTLTTVWLAASPASLVLDTAFPRSALLFNRLASLFFSFLASVRRRGPRFPRYSRRKRWKSWPNRARPGRRGFGSCCPASMSVLVVVSAPRALVVCVLSLSSIS